MSCILRHWVLTVMLFCCGDDVVHCQEPLSDFWKNAYATSDLSTLRLTEFPGVMGRGIPAEITDPAFFPLCGNGILNTKEDYLRLYGPDLDSIRMIYPKKVFFDAYSVSRTDPDVMYSFAMISDEVCDDGNRKDLDGCSSDCMVIDLLTSSCEISMDRQLQYEDALPVPLTADMIISAFDGIYLMKGGGIFDEQQQSERNQPLTLLYKKDFPVKNLYYSAGELFIYSSVLQFVWKLNQNSLQPNSLSVVLDLSAILQKNGDICVEEGSSGGILIFRDANTMLVTDIGNSTVIASCSFPVAFDASCNFQSKTREYVYLICFKSGTAYTMNPTSTNSDKKICSSNSFSHSSIGYDNVWRDAVDSLRELSIQNLFPVPGFYSKFNPGLNDNNNNAGWVVNPTPTLIRGQVMGGVVFEAMANSPRMLFDKKNINAFFVTVGDELAALFTAMMYKQNTTCGPAICFFDRPVGYDAMATAPYSHVSDNNNSRKWMDVLQELIDKEIARLLLISGTISDLRYFKGTLSELRFFNGSFNYQKVIQSFSDIYQASVSSRLVKKLFIHPKTNNMWMIRENSLHEISRSGVQLHVDNGLCIPSYIAICPVCFWAESGTACRPCSMGEVASTAWRMSCDLLCPLPSSKKPTSSSSSSSRRRLLLTEKTNRIDGSVIFVVTGGNMTMLKAVWPNASFTVWNGTEISVVLKSNDMQATIASTVVTLLNRLAKTVTVLVSPYGIESGSGFNHIVFVIDSAASSSSSNNNNTNTTLLLKTLWPSGSIILVGEQNITVTIPTSNDPRDDMLSVKQVLAANLDIRLLVNPYLRVELVSSSISTTTTTTIISIGSSNNNNTNNNSNNNTDTYIVFVINNNNTNYYTRLKTLWPSSIILIFGENTTVKIRGDDMLSVKQVLADNLDLRLLEPPYLKVEDRRSSSSSTVVLSGPDAAPSPGNVNSSSGPLIDPAVLWGGAGGAIVFVFVMYVVVHLYFRHRSAAVAHPPPMMVGRSDVNRCQYTAMDDLFQGIHIA